MWCVWTIIFVVATQTLVLRGQDAEKKTVILGEYSVQMRQIPQTL
jgi:hypothetical protein